MLNVVVMIRLSFWARDHKWAARIIIVVCMILLCFVGSTTGRLLREMQLALPETFLTMAIAVYLLAFALYPLKMRRTKGDRPKRYLRRKMSDLILLTATFAMTVYIGNYTGPFSFTTEAKAAFISYPQPPKDSTIKSYLTATEFAASMKDKNNRLLKWEERKKVLQAQVKAVKKADGLSRGGQTALIILCLLLAAGLELGVLALSCSLSCSGSAGASILVAFGGTGLVILLTVWAIRAIRKKRKEPQTTTPVKNSES